MLGEYVLAEILTYHQISTDTVPAERRSGCLSAGFFDEGPYLDGSTRVTCLGEKEIVRWLMLFRPSRELLFGELGFYGAPFYRPEVVEPFYSPGTGDLDLVVCNRYRPDQTGIIEFKRVKLTVVDAENDHINRIEDVRNGVGQANRRHNQFGFHQTYLCVVTTIDASGQGGTNVPCRGISPASTPDYGQSKTFKRIVEFPGRDELNPEIGIVFVELVQPSALSIDRRATIRVCVHRRAKSRLQLSAETNRVVMLFREHLAA